MSTFNKTGNLSESAHKNGFLINKTKVNLTYFSRLTVTLAINYHIIIIPKDKLITLET